MAPIPCDSLLSHRRVMRHGILVAETPFLNKPFSKDALARKVRAILYPTATGS